MARKETAHCARCGSVLHRASWLDLDSWLALTVAAAVVFVIANVCPVIRISFGGQENETTLWWSVCALAQGPAAPVVVPAALSLIIVPFLQIVLLGWVLGFARVGRRAPAFARVMRLLGVLRPWSMVEVGVLGLLVAAVKLSNLVRVEPGPGIWATGVLMVLITLIASRDLHSLWDWTEAPPRSGGSS